MFIRNPLANILKSEEIHDSEAPVVNYFSSRGPNRIIPEILKVPYLSFFKILSFTTFIVFNAYDLFIVSA